MSKVPKSHLQIADTNNDGKLSKSEKKYLLSIIDLDGEKGISKAENVYANALGNIAAQDGNVGFSSYEEKQAKAYKDKLFYLFDGNSYSGGDGKLSADELKDYNAKILDTQGTAGIVDMSDLQATAVLAGGAMNRVALGIMKELKDQILFAGDNNRNGKLSTEESRELLKIADFNHDGFIDWWTEAPIVDYFAKKDGKAGLSEKEKIALERYVTSEDKSEPDDVTLDITNYPYPEADYNLSDSAFSKQS